MRSRRFPEACTSPHAHHLWADANVVPVVERLQTIVRRVAHGCGSLCLRALCCACQLSSRGDKDTSASTAGSGSYLLTDENSSRFSRDRSAAASGW